MALVRDPNDYSWSGVHAFGGTVSLPDGTVSDGDVAVAANIDHAKVQHRVFAVHKQAAGTDVVAQTEILHIAHAASSILEVKAVADAVPAGGDKSVTIDVKKSTGGGAFATILDDPIVIDSGETDKTVVNGVLDGSPTLAEDDLLEIVVTVAGSTGTQAQGLLVAITIAENGA